MRNLIILSIFLVGCGTSVRSTVETRARVKSAPDWYLDRPTSNTYVYGVATAESQDMNFAIEMAESMARADVGRQVEVKYGEMQKRFQEQTRLTEGSDMLQQFTLVYKQVMSERLVGVRTKEQKVIPGNGIYIVYTMVEMPIGEANKAFIQNLRQREVLYTRVRSTELYRELDQSVRQLDSLRTP